MLFVACRVQPDFPMFNTLENKDPHFLSTKQNTGQGASRDGGRTWGQKTVQSGKIQCCNPDGIRNGLNKFKILYQWNDLKKRGHAKTIFIYDIEIFRAQFN